MLLGTDGLVIRGNVIIVIIWSVLLSVLELLVFFSLAQIAACCLDHLALSTFNITQFKDS